jgi:hypothetical protein
MLAETSEKHLYNLKEQNEQRRQQWIEMGFKIELSDKRPMHLMFYRQHVVESISYMVPRHWIILQP